MDTTEATESAKAKADADDRAKMEALGAPPWAFAFQTTLLSANAKTDAKITDLSTHMQEVKHEVAAVKAEQAKAKMSHTILADKVEDIISGKIRIGGGSSGSSGGGTGGTSAAPSNTHAPGNTHVLAATLESEPRDLSALVFTFCGYKERATKGYSLDALKAFARFLEGTPHFNTAEGKELLADANWTPGGRVMFSAQIHIPPTMRHMAMVIKDTAIESLEGSQYATVKVGFPKTAGQRSRGKIIGICCSLVEELFNAKLGEKNFVCKVVQSPNRIQIVHGINTVTVIKLARDLDNAKITLEAADLLGKPAETLQRQLEDWLE